MARDKLVAINSFPVWLPQTQTWMYNQLKYLPGSVEAHVVCERTENLDQFPVPNIHSLQDVSCVRYLWEKALRNLQLSHTMGFLTSVACQVGAKIVHSHFGNIGWMNLESVRRAHSKHVVSFYGYDVNMLPAQHKKWSARYQKLFDEADVFLCEGSHMAEQLVKLGCLREKVRVHHLGVEVKNIPYKPRHWHKDEPLRVLIASSFQEKKGIPYALEALARLQRNVALEITIIGEASPQKRSRKEKQRILEVIKHRGLSSKTKLLGFQPYSALLKEAYQHHIFVSPSVTASDGDTEGGAPVSIIEMIATGMPVVSTLHCDIPEVVHYGMENWLVKERNVDALIDRLWWLLEHSQEWEELLTQGRRHIETKFNAVEQGKILEKIYHDVVDRRNEFGT